MKLLICTEKKEKLPTPSVKIFLLISLVFAPHNIFLFLFMWFSLPSSTSSSSHKKRRTFISTVVGAAAAERERKRKMQIIH
jgi:hypothetical protein